MDNSSSSRRQLSTSVSGSAKKLRLDSLNKILKIDSIQRKKSRRKSLSKQLSLVALADLIKETPANTTQDLPDLKTFLSDPTNIHLFREFLESQFCRENLDFYLACEKYRKLEPERVGKDLIKFMAIQIYNDYLAKDAKYPINVDYNCAQNIAKRIKEPTADLFKEPQIEILNLMRNDCYPRFCKTWRIDRDTARRILHERTSNNNNNNKTPMNVSHHNCSTLTSNSAASTSVADSSYLSFKTASSQIATTTGADEPVECPKHCPYFRNGLPCLKHVSQHQSTASTTTTSMPTQRKKHFDLNLSRIHAVPNCCRRRTPPPPPLPPKIDFVDLGPPPKMKKLRPYVGQEFNV